MKTVFKTLKSRKTLVLNFATSVNTVFKNFKGRKRKSGIIIGIIVIPLLLSLSIYWTLKSPPKKPVLRILTYSSFVSLYGPGRRLQKKFEQTCSCQIEWMIAEDSTGLIQRLALPLKVDLVIGLDQLSLAKTDSLIWKKISIPKELFVPEVKEFLNSPFIPINWAPIGWIYRTGEMEPPNRFLDMLSLKGKISFPDPHSSTLGQQWYYWIYNSFSGQREEIENFLQKLKPKIYGRISSWSLAYGFFQKKHSQMSLSYLTSLAYHANENSTHPYRFAYFKGGHPYQVEFVGLLKTEKPSATAFVKFLLSRDSQILIMNTHYMFPAVKGIRQGFFLQLKPPDLISYKDIKGFQARKPALLKLWNKTLY